MKQKLHHLAGQGTSGREWELWALQWWLDTLGGEDQRDMEWAVENFLTCCLLSSLAKSPGGLSSTLRWEVMAQLHWPSELTSWGPFHRTHEGKWKKRSLWFYLLVLTNILWNHCLFKPSWEDIHNGVGLSEPPSTDVRGLDSVGFEGDSGEKSVVLARCNLTPSDLQENIEGIIQNSIFTCSWNATLGDSFFTTQMCQRG